MYRPGHDYRDQAFFLSFLVITCFMSFGKSIFMIRFVIPYSTDKRLFEAYDREVMLLENDTDWVCFLDGDTAFLTHNWGHVIADYTKKYPDTGLFTCYASRCHYQWQLPPQSRMEEPSILYHRMMAKQLDRNYQGQVMELKKIIAGHLMVIQKSTWVQIRDELKKTTASKKILGVDTKISHAVMRTGKKIRLMQSIYLLHYLRMAEGINNTSHLR